MEGMKEPYFPSLAERMRLKDKFGINIFHCAGCGDGFESEDGEFFYRTPEWETAETFRKRLDESIRTGENLFIRDYIKEQIEPYKPGVFVD